MPSSDGRRWSLFPNFKTPLDLFNGRSQIGEVVAGRYLRDLPSKKIKPFSKDPVSALCAPPGCMADVHQRVRNRLDPDDRTSITQDMIIKNVKDWHQRKDFADGLATSLYEKTSADENEKKLIGDPVADSLAIVTRKDSCILALADGVSWGQKSKLASTCSVYGSVKYINDNLHECKNTKDVFRCILNGFEKAQACIVSEQATMTTLCVAVVVPLHEKDRWALCVVNVGDSYAYVYSREKRVKEVTEFSHPIDEKRDMRQSGGALGPADGYNPDLGNLTCSFVTVEKGDLVYLCSDGVSDNFDPAIAKFTPNVEKRNLNTEQSFEEVFPPERNVDGSVTTSNEIVSRDDDDVVRSQTPIIIPNEDELYHLEGIHNLCYNCMNEQSNKNPVNIPALSTGQSNKDPANIPVISNPQEKKPHKSKIQEFFPNISEIPSNRTQKDDNGLLVDRSNSIHTEMEQFRCKKCGNAITYCYKEDRRCSVLEFSPTKLSTSASMDQILDNANSLDEDEMKSRLKSSSFSTAGVNDTIFNDLHQSKEAAVSILKQSSSVAKLNSHPSIDFSTGKKNKQQNSSDKLTCRERRIAALERMAQEIDIVEPGEDGHYNVGEVCAQIINYVLCNTDKKRKILERVPQSELANMASKERKEHNEKIKKELEGIPGKLDHASIVCYEVGIHGNLNTFKLDRQKSSPAGINTEGELPPNTDEDSLEVHIVPENIISQENVSKVMYDQTICNEMEAI